MLPTALQHGREASGGGGRRARGVRTRERRKGGSAVRGGARARGVGRAEAARVVVFFPPTSSPVVSLQSPHGFFLVATTPHLPLKAPLFVIN